MIRRIRTALIVGATGIAISTFAQSGTTMSAPAEAGATSAVVVPPDQQPSKEQLAKLFDVMQLKEQMQSMRQMKPGYDEGNDERDG